MTLNKLAIAGLFVAAWVSRPRRAASPPGCREPSSRDIAAQAQEQGRKRAGESPSPSLPGAVTQPPAWLDNPAPFDVAAFFAAPPPEENAAPSTWKPSSSLARKWKSASLRAPIARVESEAVEQRLARFRPVFQSWSKDPSSVPAATIDAVVSEFDTGFRKLDWAQQRPRCVFQTGIGATARIPHAQVVSNVGRVARLKVSRELERGELDAALRDLARLLRLSRDLLPRGVMIADIVSASADRGTVGTCGRADADRERSDRRALRSDARTIS